MKFITVVLLSALAVFSPVVLSQKVEPASSSVVETAKDVSPMNSSERGLNAVGGDIVFYEPNGVFPCASTRRRLSHENSDLSRNQFYTIDLEAGVTYVFEVTRDLIQCALYPIAYLYQGECTVTGDNPFTISGCTEVVENRNVIDRPGCVAGFESSTESSKDPFFEFTPTTTGKYTLRVAKYEEDSCTDAGITEYKYSAIVTTPASEQPSSIPSFTPSSQPSSEPSWVDDEQCKKKDSENDICAELDGRCKTDCEDDENFVCVPGLCSYDRNWDKPTKSPKMRQLKEDDVEVVDFEITADGGVERKLKATKAPSEKEAKTTKAPPKGTKAPKSSCACRVPRKHGCKK
ncbi:predicted protein [Chaetoceros tenuissimus]|uniref:Uncharacterized protein n=1 Tax=Chaetoceros tenuissimus TaxID=426638 RepID=A0AAD3CR63_9STRA|nr:predicted protein [Chaetoceros tenuissimus]